MIASRTLPGYDAVARALVLAMTLVLPSADGGLVCLEEKGIPDPTTVTTVARCGPHEVCGMEQYITHDGSVRHNLLCKDKQQCTSVITSPGDIHICSACCDTNLCSANLCKNKGLPSGTYCLHCDYPVKTPLNCEHIQRCSQDEECGLNQIQPSNEFEVKCRSKTSCAALVSTTTSCSGCCDTNVCNDQCSSSNQPATACLDDAVCAGIKQNFISSGRDVCADATFKKFCNLTCGLCATTPAVMTSPTTSATVKTTIMTTTPASPCRPNPCVHGACSSTGSSAYQCTCNSGYTGTTCNIVDPCSTVQCQHGQCSSTSGTAVCVCDPGFSGIFCDKASPCQPNPCTHGTCTPTTGSSAYQCTCSTGYTGTTCNTASPCSSNPCVHGTCSSSTGSSTFQCSCSNGFTGTTCNIASPCNSNPCVHGTCSSSTGSSTYQCTCSTGFTGTTCNMVASPCVPNPCVHGTCGVQSTSASGYSCTCNTGYTGVDCDTVDPCASRQCLHGKCTVSSVGAAVCVCDAGYKGAYCDTDVDECASSPCQHGSCMDQVNDYICTCSLGYTGKNCDTATATPCSPNPCVHGTCGLLSTSASGYSCTCNMGYTGVNCTTLTNPCASSPCLHGRCVDQASSYTCQCDVGYYEVNCDKKIRDCKDVLDGHLPSPTGDQIYTVKIGQTNENVRCDMATDGGGWTVIMNRETATINFTKDSTDYALGFGNSRSDFWIGLEDMHKLTSDGRKYQLRVELTRGDGSQYYEIYDDFSIGPPRDFVLHIGAARGTAGDALRHHDGYGFTTVDHDVDSNKNDNCAHYLQGAWWFHECYDSCLTCPYETPGALNKCRSMSWNTVNYCEALKAARMLVRPM